ncbi:unnamed protein product, partial [Closterium sp. NIES-53]
ASGQVFAAASWSGPESAPCSCRLLSHQTLLWHHRLGHPSLPHLRGMASRVLLTGLPRSLPPLPPGPAPTCVPCVEGRQRAAPHSSEFPPTEAPLQTLHMDIGGEFSSDLLRAFCRAEGIRQTFTLPASPQQNGIAECRIGMVMDVARTSMIHAAAPYFIWPFAVQYAAHQINLKPRVSLPETTPTLQWTGKVGDASAFHPCVFLGFPPDAPGWQFYHPTSRRVLSSQDVTFDESVPYYHAVEPVEVAVDCGAARGVEPAGAGSGGAEPERAEPGGAESGGAEPWVAESGGAEPEGAEPARVESGGATPRGPSGASSRREPLSPQQLREWFARRWSRAAGAGGATGTGCSTAAGGAVATGPGGARTGDTGVAMPGGARDGATGAAGGAARAGGVGPDTGGAGAVPGGSRGAARPQPPSYSPPPHCLLLLLTLVRQEVLRSVVSMSLVLRRLFVLLALVIVVRVSVLLLSLARTRWLCVLPLLRSVSLCRLLLRPLFLPSDLARAASPTVTRLLATVVTDPSLVFTDASALVPELVDFAAHCRLDYAASLVAESKSVCPPSAGGECALSTDILEDRQEEFQHLRRRGSPTWGEHCRWHVDFRVNRPLGSPPVFKARYVARGFSQRQGVDYFQTFSSTPKMTTLRVLLHLTAQRDYELHSLDFSTAFLQGSLHEEIWLRRTPGFTGSFPPGTQWSLRRPVYGLRQAPREWHDTLRTTLAALGFAPSTADPSLFLRTDTTLSPFYILVYVDDLVFATPVTAGLAHVKSELQKRHACTNLVPSALQLYVLLASGHSSVYSPFALSSVFG